MPPGRGVGISDPPYIKGSFFRPKTENRMDGVALTAPKSDLVFWRGGGGGGGGPPPPPPPGGGQVGRRAGRGRRVDFGVGGSIKKKPSLSYPITLYNAI